jgi:hypothetical protein
MNSIILYGALLLAATIATAQTPDSTRQQYEFEMKDGNFYVGFIVDSTGEDYIVETIDYGRVTLYRARVERKRIVSSAYVSDRYYNPQASTRYFWAPSAYGLKAGEGYYQNVWVFFNQVSVGLSDNFSLGIGMIPLFLFAGAPSPVWIAPKVSVPISEGSLAIGGGALLGAVIGDEQATFGITYGTVTLGSRENNLSLSLGYGMTDGEWASSPMISVSAMAKVSERTSFVTENYYIPADDLAVMLSLGFRTAFTGIGLDYGLWIPLGADAAVIIPWLGISVPFGTTGPDPVHAGH